MFYKTTINPLVANGLSHPYHLDESIFILGASGVIFHFYFIFDEIPVSKQNSPRWDAMFCGVTSGIFCLPMSRKKDAMPIWVNQTTARQNLYHWTNSHCWSLRMLSSVKIHTAQLYTIVNVPQSGQVGRCFALGRAFIPIH